jgi:RNA12 protein
VVQSFPFTCLSIQLTRCRAAGLTSANIAHVIFLTQDVSYTKTLNKALPDRVFRQIALSDSSPEAAKRFVISRLDADGELSEDPDHPERKLTPSQRRKDLVELDEVIEIVGGRLTDLEFLARRIKAGETPHRAVREIVEQSASEILKMYLIAPDESTTGKKRWNPTQAWLLIKQLAASKDASLRYNEISLDDIFKAAATGGPDAVLQALEQAELINIVVSPSGRPQSIRPGKPVYHAAFQRLTEDTVLQSRLDLSIAADLIKVETATIDKCEAELKLLADLPKQPYEITPRIRWLLGKISASQAKVEQYEKDSAVLKGILKTDF